MDTLNSPASVQEPTSSSGNSPDARQDGAGVQAQKRVDDLMGLANRRLTAQQRAEEERDAALAEIDALRASMDDGWQAERDTYWQREQPADAAPAGEDEAGEDGEEDGEPPPLIMSVNPQRPDHQPRSSQPSEPPLDAVRATFNALAERENERLKTLRDWP